LPIIQPSNNINWNILQPVLLMMKGIEEISSTCLRINWVLILQTRKDGIRYLQRMCYNRVYANVLFYHTCVTRNVQAGQRVVECHQGSHVKAIVELYPQLHLDEKKFKPITRMSVTCDEIATIVKKFLSSQRTVGKTSNTDGFSLICLLVKKDSIQSTKRSVGMIFLWKKYCSERLV
jgi:hypothetical protein